VEVAFDAQFCTHPCVAVADAIGVAGPAVVRLVGEDDSRVAETRAEPPRSVWRLHSLEG
jgi:hypothetical protein